MTEEKRKNREWVEEVEVKGRELVDRVKELIEQGNVRRLIIRKSNGEVLIEVPLTAGVMVGGAALVFAPLFAMLGAAAAFFAELKIEVVRVEEETQENKADEPQDEARKRRIEID